MDNITINRILKKIINIDNNYLGIFTPSQLNYVNIDRYNHLILILFIPNISKTYGHWCCLIKIKKVLYFLDSFGLNPDLYNFNLKHNLKTKKKYLYYYLNLQIQSNYTTVCGAYAIYFIHTLILCKYNINCLKKEIIRHLKNKNKLKNDYFIIQYMYNNFKKDLPFNCQNIFCNDKFIIKRKLCIETLCR